MTDTLFVRKIRQPLRGEMIETLDLVQFPQPSVSVGKAYIERDLTHYCFAHGDLNLSNVVVIDYKDYPALVSQSFEASTARNLAVYDQGIPVAHAQPAPALVIELSPDEEPEAHDTLADEFSALVTEWEEETAADSSLTKIFTHPAYQRIIAMGKDALPLILPELKNNSGQWFYALTFIVGKDVAAGADGYGEARAKWLEWGHKHGYI